MLKLNSKYKEIQDVPLFIVEFKMSGIFVGARLTLSDPGYEISSHAQGGRSERPPTPIDFNERAIFDP